MDIQDLEEVGDADIELASVAGDVAVSGITVHKAVVIAYVEADHIEEVNGYAATEHHIETTVVVVVIVVVDLGILRETGHRTFNLVLEARP